MSLNAAMGKLYQVRILLQADLLRLRTKGIALKTLRASLRRGIASAAHPAAKPKPHQAELLGQGPVVSDVVATATCFFTDYSRSRRISRRCR